MRNVQNHNPINLLTLKEPSMIGAIAASDAVGDALLALHQISAFVHDSLDFLTVVNDFQELHLSTSGLNGLGRVIGIVENGIAEIMAAIDPSSPMDLDSEGQ